MDDNYDDDQHNTQKFAEAQAQVNAQYGKTLERLAVSEWLDSLAALGEDQEKAEASYGEECHQYWNSLSKDQQLMAFAHVTRTIHHGLRRGLSYRGILYSLFEFGPEAYGIGIASGFFDIYNHNGIETRTTTDGEAKAE